MNNLKIRNEMSEMVINLNKNEINTSFFDTKTALKKIINTNITQEEFESNINLMLVLIETAKKKKSWKSFYQKYKENMKGISKHYKLMFKIIKLYSGKSDKINLDMTIANIMSYQNNSITNLFHLFAIIVNSIHEKNMMKHFDKYSADYFFAM